MEFADFCKNKIVWIFNTINQINIALETSHIYRVINITCVNLVMQKFNKSYTTILYYKKSRENVVLGLVFFLQRWLKNMLAFSPSGLGGK